MHRLIFPTLLLSLLTAAPDRLRAQTAAPAVAEGFAKWEKEIAAFEAQDREHPP